VAAGAASVSVGATVAAAQAASGGPILSLVARWTVASAVAALAINARAAAVLAGGAGAAGAVLFWVMYASQLIPAAQ
jgi:hypothetical protein